MTWPGSWILVVFVSSPNPVNPSCPVPNDFLEAASLVEWTNNKATVCLAAGYAAVDKTSLGWQSAWLTNQRVPSVPVIEKTTQLVKSNHVPVTTLSSVAGIGQNKSLVGLHAGCPICPQYCNEGPIFSKQTALEQPQIDTVLFTH